MSLKLREQSGCPRVVVRRAPPDMVRSKVDRQGRRAAHPQGQIGNVDKQSSSVQDEIRVSNGISNTICRHRVLKR